MKNKKLNIIVVAISACIFFSFFIFNKGFGSLIKELKALNMYWIFFALMSIILFWTFETMILHTITKKLYSKEYSFFQSVKFQMVGQFFGAITPLSAGSQPAQLYEMTKYGIPAGLSGSILMIKFMLHELINIFYLLVALLFRFSYFNSKIKHFTYFALLGIVINIAVMLFAILVVVNRRITEIIMQFILKILGAIRILKDVKAKQKKVEEELKSFHKNALLMREHIDMCTYVLIYTLFQWLTYFSIPYFIYRGFGFNYQDLWTIMAAQVFLTVFMSAIPLPGAEGGAEGGFYVIFKLFFKSNTIITALFIWRVLTYYLSIAVSSAFILAISNTHLRKKC
ncbi:flippase-like domain-containing protein [Clostridium sp. PL3]|uniref:Phosphatidylglycerol lysyltransferase n=1 Tax=Clostridium thailandense TaxID=2794346 RepID=A0A949WW98_9CLOT|nr:lysylphosphatidylglycerol synthase transmembrane domain-containing protein [Clostridium thailandense]MBV7274567.1 flippase-like domain-containing protein [Clostridium thailandense]